MKAYSSLLFNFIFFLLAGCASHQPSQPSSLVDQDPAQLYGELLQLAPVFSDSKHFVDMNPKQTPSLILDNYKKQKPESREQLTQFVVDNFSEPKQPEADFKNLPRESIDEHIKRLWPYLTRQPDEETNQASSLIPLPFSYVVPGGRFREIYYWDSYFTQLGLLADQEDELFQNMVRNFSYLIMSLGKIPNGNRDYYRGRSQAPFFSYMVSLWQERLGKDSVLPLLPALKKEYEFWMKGERAVAFKGSMLNRYWDDFARPRPEAYKEDIELAQKAQKLYKRPLEETYRDIRAAAESGWDFSTRWFQDPKEFASIQTTSLLPIDLNCLLYHLELKIAELSQLSGEQKEAKKFSTLAQKRKSLIQKYFWDEHSQTFHDYNFQTKKLSGESTIAMVVALFTEVATPQQAKAMGQVLKKKFLKPGGVVTTLRTSNQQWDIPNGWPPHQWMTYAGLKLYHQDTLAEEVRKRWLSLNQKVFQSTGKMVEKYNVMDLSLQSGGGEYPLQDGFGWTNGVYRALSTPDQSIKHLLFSKAQ